MRMLIRAYNAPRKTQSMSKAKKPKAKTCPQLFDEVKVSGWGGWRKNKKIVTEYCWPVVIRISRTETKGEYYKSVHAARNTPARVMVGLYLGEVAVLFQMAAGALPFLDIATAATLSLWTARLPAIGLGNDTLP
jgi:hypothetical protein